MAVDDTPIVPIFDADRGWRMWHKPDIYTGEEGSTGRWVPNVDDLIIDYANGFERVIDVDMSTGLSTLLTWVLPKEADGLTNEDILLGLGPGSQSESFRAMLDDSVVPHTLALDSRLHFYGSSVKWIKIFRGTDISAVGEVVSAYYDQSNTYLGENIPVELVQTPDPSVDNRAILAPMVGYTNAELDEGEVLTAVAYSDTGMALSIAKLLVKNTAFIRTTDASRRFISSIHLESPFVSASDDRIIEYPINMPVSALPLTGVVTYSDGKTLKHPVDGTKFRIHGLEHYVASQEGQRIPLVLTYYLESDEYNYGSSPGASRHLSEKYWATTKAFDEAYEIKLYAYPTWVDDVQGYRMEFFLYNLNRGMYQEVTTLVRLGNNTPAFQPLNFTQTQHLTYVINMNDVDSKYPSYRHVQTVDVQLMAPGTEDTTNWIIGFNPGQDPKYGHNLSLRATFVDSSNWKVKVDNGFASESAWLEELFYRSQPLFNREREEQAPLPNYFVLNLQGREFEYQTSQWSEEFTLPSVIEEGETAYIRWIKRTSEGDLQLGISGLPVHQEIAS